MKRKPNNYVVHMTPLTGMIASVRIAIMISEITKAKLISTPEECSEALDEGGVNSVIVVNGPPAFCKFRDDLAKLVLSAETWIWVQNDYTIYPPSQINKWARLYHRVGASESFRAQVLWTTKQTATLPGHEASAYVNWNALTMRTPAEWGRRYKNFVYFGAFRQNRKKRFLRYLPTDCHISAPGRAGKHFADMGFETIVPPVEDVVTMLSQYKATICIHDRRTDRHEEFPPNRFYEALSARTAVFMDESMAKRLREAGYKVRLSYVIGDKSELRKKIATASLIAAHQNDDWANLAMRHKRELKNQVRALYRRISC